MSNYPPGMTPEDWAHIEGAEHHRDCEVHRGSPECNCALLDREDREDAEQRRFESRQESPP